ncbi:hypothetical protein NMG60_11023353 [Bertholletia excelsa]
MYGVGSSQAISRDMNLLFSPTSKHSDVEFPRNKEFVTSDLYHHQQNQQSSSLMRLRSAPSSFFEDFLNPPHQSSSPESESVFARLMSTNGSGGCQPQDLQFPAAIKNETQEYNQYSTSTSTQMIYKDSLEHCELGNRSDSTSTHANPDGLYKVANVNSTENQVQGKTITGNFSNLIRQSSSPAGLFSDLVVQNGFALLRDVGNFRVGNGTNGKVSPIRNLNDHINFSTGPSSSSRFMPRIAENENESDSQESGHLNNSNTSNGFYTPSFQNDSWNDSGFTGGIKRNRDGEDKKFFGFNVLENQNVDSRNYTIGLTHHLSLPKTSAEIAAVEKFLQFQRDSVPCKMRAKRGCATHPRSIAERMRRTRISERMRKLQELFPDMDKQTNTADMLDLAVEYIKDLQKQVKALTDTRAKCTCLSKQKQFPNPTA